MRLFNSLKSSYWVIWSSPLLLLVLVFTLTTTSSSAPRRHGSLSAPTTTNLRRDAATPSPLTSTTTSTTSTTTTIPTRKHAGTALAGATATPSTMSVRHATNSSRGTASNDKPVANAPAESAANGALSGQLTPSFAVADVPLDGPGTWNVVTSAPVKMTLRCESQSVNVQAQFVIGAHERCQLTITPATPSTTLTWQLTPVN